MIDIGVASPSAHGQAMISTATAATSACASARLGPEHEPQRRRRSAATATTAGTNHAGDGVGERWIGARLRCASATSATIRARSVSAPDALGAHHEAAGAVERRAGSRATPASPSPPASARR